MFNPIKITDLDLNEVKNYLRVDHEDDDLLINTMLIASKSYIQSYLNKKFSEYVEIPDEFTIACLSLISHWYERREIQSEKAASAEMSYVFSGLLNIHRNWLDERKPTEVK